jgi:hypothetical protein
MAVAFQLVVLSLVNGLNHCLFLCKVNKINCINGGLAKMRGKLTLRLLTRKKPTPTPLQPLLPPLSLVLGDQLPSLPLLPLGSFPVHLQLPLPLLLS